MKSFVLAALASLAIFSVSSFADEGYWPKSYFIEAGMGAMVSKGDFSERNLSVKDTAGTKGIVHLPALELFAMPTISIGANIAQFTLDLNFQYWSISDQTISGFPDESFKGDSRIWRIGFDFMYNLFWPDFFQIGLGAGYSYTSIKTKNTAYFDDQTSSSEIMGSAVNATANLQYFLTDHIAIVPAIRIYENWFKNIYTTSSENSDLDSYVWQTFVLASVSIRYQF